MSVSEPQSKVSELSPCVSTCLAIGGHILLNLTGHVLLKLTRNSVLSFWRIVPNRDGFLSVIDGLWARLFIVMTEIPGLTPSASNRNCNAQPARQAHCFNALQCFSDGLCKGLSKPRKTSSGTAKEYRPSILMWSKINGDRRATSSSQIGYPLARS